jgi:hypothetical protein
LLPVFFTSTSKAIASPMFPAVTSGVAASCRTSSRLSERLHDDQRPVGCFTDELACLPRPEHKHAGEGTRLRRVEAAGEGERGLLHLARLQGEVGRRVDPRTEIVRGLDGHFLVHAVVDQEGRRAGVARREQARAVATGEVPPPPGGVAHRGDEEGGEAASRGMHEDAYEGVAFGASLAADLDPVVRALLGVELNEAATLAVAVGWRVVIAGEALQLLQLGAGIGRKHRIEAAAEGVDDDAGVLGNRQSAPDRLLHLAALGRLALLEGGVEVRHSEGERRRIRLVLAVGP